MKNPRCLILPLAATAALAVAAPAAAQSKQAKPIRCVGTAQTCQATISLAGGASNKQIRIGLPGTDQRLISTSVRPHWVQGAYSLTRQRYIEDGFLFTARLNAVQSIPKGARLTLLFQAPLLASGCQSRIKDIAYLSIHRHGTPTAGALSCQQASAVAQTWSLRFRDGEQVERFSVNDVRYRCRVVPRVPQNMQCDGGGTRIRFAGPTGR